MKLSQYLHEIVEPNVADFMEDRSNLRLGINASWSLDAFASHLFEAKKEAGYYSEDDRDNIFKKRLADANVEFSIVWSVSTAAKHGKISKKIIRTIAEIQKVPVEGILAIALDVSDYFDWGDRLLIANEEFGARPLDLAVQNSFEMLRSESSEFL